MNEINKLIWPNSSGIGLMDPDEFARTAKIALDYKVIKKPASKAAYRTELAKKAIAELEEGGEDVTGEELGEARGGRRLSEGGK